MRKLSKLHGGFFGKPMANRTGPPLSVKGLQDAMAKLASERPEYFVKPCYIHIPEPGVNPVFDRVWRSKRKSI